MRSKLTVALTHAATFGPDIAAVQSMKHPSENQPQEVLAGYVERVAYQNAENGFCVLRAKARGHRDVVTAPRSWSCFFTATAPISPRTYATASRCRRRLRPPACTRCWSRHNLPLLPAIR